MLYILQQLITEVLFGVSDITIDCTSVCARVVADVLSILMCSSCMVMHGKSTYACVSLPIMLSDYISDDL